MIVCGYHAHPLPPRGGEIVFHPLEHLQPIKYCRPGLMFLNLDNNFSDIDPSCLREVNQVIHGLYACLYNCRMMFSLSYNGFFYFFSNDSS